MTDYAVRVAVVVLAVVLVAAGGTALGASPAEDGTTGLGSETFAQSEVDADRIVLDVAFQENGTAIWRVAYRVELRTDNETAAFEDLQADIEANRSAYQSAFRERMDRTARVAENATGREMSVRGVSVSANTEAVQGYGTVEYTFRWTNFATVDGDRIQAGDALAGFFLETDSRLRISWPDGYEATTLSPEPDDRRDTTAVWIGPLEFGSSGPRFVVEPAGLPMAAIGGIAVVGIALAVGLWLYVNRGEDEAETPGEAADTPSAAGGTEPETDADDSAGPAEELLSNEERVLRLLEEQEGRVKQQAVKQEFDWTDAKTSQVVNALKDEEKIEVFRLGRENVLVLPEESEL